MFVIVASNIFTIVYPLSVPLKRVLKYAYFYDVNPFLSFPYVDVNILGLILFYKGPKIHYDFITLVRTSCDIYVWMCHVRDRTSFAYWHKGNYVIASLVHWAKITWAYIKVYCGSGQSYFCSINLLWVVLSNKEYHVLFRCILERNKWHKCSSYTSILLADNFW